MRRFSLVLASLLLFVLKSAHAGTLVQLDTPLGSMKFELYDAEKPITVANFLNYITSGRYTNTFAHRLAEDFVLQGGGFTLDGNAIIPVPTFSPIVNEAGPFPQFSNIYGTLAMAKLDGDPHSATSQWFINLNDNSANLDVQNGGFTVFGHIVDGEAVLLEFLDFIKLPPGITTANNVIVNFGGAFSELPAIHVDGPYAEPVMTTWIIVPESSTIALLVLSALVLGRTIWNGCLRRL